MKIIFDILNVAVGVFLGIILYWGCMKIIGLFKEIKSYMKVDNPIEKVEENKPVVSMIGMPYADKNEENKKKNKEEDIYPDGRDL